jgi:hypothetical protein
MKKIMIEYMELPKFSFIGKPSQAGRHFYLTIPRTFIKNSIINKEKTYKVHLIKIIDERNDLSDAQKQILTALDVDDTQLRTLDFEDVIMKLRNEVKIPKKQIFERVIYFLGKPARAGSHFSFTIPKIFVENKIISLNHLYRVHPEEIKIEKRKSFDDASEKVIEGEVELSKKEILDNVVKFWNERN